MIFCKQVTWRKRNLPIVDCLIKHASQTDWLQNQSFFNAIFHKTNTIRTLARCEQLICYSPGVFHYEKYCLKHVFGRKWMKDSRNTNELHINQKKIKHILLNITDRRYISLNGLLQYIYSTKYRERLTWGGSYTNLTKNSF